MLLVLKGGHPCCVGFWSSGEGIPTVFGPQGRASLLFLVLRGGHPYYFFGPQGRAPILFFGPQGRVSLLWFWSSGESILTVYVFGPQGKASLLCSSPWQVAVMVWVLCCLVTPPGLCWIVLPCLQTGVHRMCGHHSGCLQVNSSTWWATVIIIAVISIALVPNNKGEHNVLNEINNNEYVKTWKVKRYIVILYS